MQTIHASLKSKLAAEMQQGVFNDVNEVGTSKQKRSKKKKSKVKALSEPVQPQNYLKKITPGK